MKKKLYSFLLAVFLAATSSFVYADITSGLRLHYNFEEEEIVDDTVRFVKDLTSNGLNGLIEGDLAYTEGFLSDKAVALVDTNKRIKAPENVLLNVQNFTIAFWVKQNSLPKWSRFLDFGLDATRYMYVATDGDIGDYLRFEICTNRDSLNWIKANRTLSIGKWNHVAITGDYTVDEEGVVTSSVVKIYINGVLNAQSNPLDETLDTDLRNRQFRLTPGDVGPAPKSRFGASQWQDPSPNCSMDDFRFYTRALTLTELEEVSGISSALKSAQAALTLTDLELEEGDVLELPETIGDFDIEWTTSDPSVLGLDGVPIPSESFVTDAVLTAFISPSGQQYPMLEKEFVVKVAPNGTPVEEIIRLEFSEASFETINDTLFVWDEGDIGFKTFAAGGAQIIPIGDLSKDELSDYFYVYASDNRASNSQTGIKQYMNLGKEIGDYVYQLRDHTVSIFYRRDTSIDKRAWHQDAGQMLWAFSNSEKLTGSWGVSGRESNGAMYFEPNDCLVAILDGVNESLGTNALRYGSGGAGKTPLGNTWHNITYSQYGGTGYLMVDAVKVAEGPMPAPKVQLKKNAPAGRTGTWYNRLGGNVSPNQVTAKNTMLWGFYLLPEGIPYDQVNAKFAITDFITKLNVAMTKTTYNIPKYLELLPALDDANKTLQIGFRAAIHYTLSDLYDEGLLYKESREVTPEFMTDLNKAIADYKQYSTEWIKLRDKLAALETQRALNYPGLEAFDADLATAQESYDKYEVPTEIFDFLDDALLTYKSSQNYSATAPADYTFHIVNPSFEEGTGGTRDSKTTGGDLQLPKGWTVLYQNKSGPYAKAYVVTNTDNPLHMNCDFEAWSDNEGNIYRAELHQTTKNPVPAGWYILSGNIRSLNNTRGGQHIYVALNDSVKIESDTLEADKPGIGWEGGYGWTLSAYKKVFVKFQLENAQQIKVGFRSDTAIFKIDDMRLAYYGSEEPAVGDITSWIKNPSFESGAREEELDGVTTTTLTADAGDVFAPKDWNLAVTTTAPNNNAAINVVTAADADGDKVFSMNADSITSLTLSQTLISANAGIYKMKAKVRAEGADTSNARLFAKVGRRTTEGVSLATAIDSSEAFTGWKELEVIFRAAINDELELGAKASTGFDVDNFSLELISLPYGFVGMKDAPAVSSNFKTYVKDGVIYIDNLTAKDRVTVYDIAGRQISVKNPSQIKVSKGMYVIKINNEVIKQLVK